MNWGKRTGHIRDGEDEKNPKTQQNSTSCNDPLSEFPLLKVTYSPELGNLSQYVFEADVIWKICAMCFPPSLAQQDSSWQIRK